jgi:uncharacterized protein (UPF0333 family)
MAVNKIKEKIEEPAPAPKKKVRRQPTVFSRAILKFMNMFGIFNRNQIVHSMPFILFVAFIVIIYIANSYFAERMIRNIDKTKTSLKEKRAEYISVMSTLMYQSNQSEVAKAVAPYNLKETIEPAYKIFVEEKK